MSGPAARAAPDGPGLRIDRDGAWWHEGQEVTHPGVRAALYASLDVDAGDRHVVRAGRGEVPVEVEDAPFVVLRVEAVPAPRGGGEELRAHLSDGTAEPLEPATLRVGPRGTPYARVKAGRFRARLALAAWLQLAARLEEGPGGAGLRLVLGSRRVDLVGLEA